MAVKMVIRFKDDVFIQGGDILYLMFAGEEGDSAEVFLELIGLDDTQEIPRAEVMYLPTMGRLPWPSSG